MTLPRKGSLISAESGEFRDGVGEMISSRITDPSGFFSIDKPECVEFRGRFSIPTRFPWYSLLNWPGERAKHLSTTSKSASAPARRVCASLSIWTILHVIASSHGDGEGTHVSLPSDLEE